MDQHKLDSLVKAKSVDEFREIQGSIDKQSLISFTDGKGRNAFLLAARDGHASVVRYLAEACIVEPIDNVTDTDGARFLR